MLSGWIFVYDLLHLFVVVEVRSLSIHCTHAKAKHEIIIKQAKLKIFYNNNNNEKK